MNTMFHVNSRAWVLFFLVGKLSSPFGDTTKFCRTWVCQRCRYFVVEENVPIERWICKEHYMFRVLSYDIDVYFLYLDMFGMCETMPNCFSSILKPISSFVYWSFFCCEHFETYKKKSRDYISWYTHESDYQMH